MIHYNKEKQLREIYMISLYEDQTYKWGVCLDVTDDIKF